MVEQGSQTHFAKDQGFTLKDFSEQVNNRSGPRIQHVDCYPFDAHSILMKANKAKTLCMIVIVIINNKGIKISHTDNNLHAEYVVRIYPFSDLMRFSRLDKRLVKIKDQGMFRTGMFHIAKNRSKFV